MPTSSLRGTFYIAHNSRDDIFVDGAHLQEYNAKFTSERSKNCEIKTGHAGVNKREMHRSSEITILLLGEDDVRHHS